MLILHSRSRRRGVRGRIGLLSAAPTVFRADMINFLQSYLALCLLALTSQQARSYLILLLRRCIGRSACSPRYGWHGELVEARQLQGLRLVQHFTGILCDAGLQVDTVCPRPVVHIHVVLRRAHILSHIGFARLVLFLPVCVEKCSRHTNVAQRVLAG